MLIALGSNRFKIKQENHLIMIKREFLQCYCIYISSRTSLLGLKLKNTWKLYHWVHHKFTICEFLFLSVTERWNWNCLWPKVKMVDWCGVVHLERYILTILKLWNTLLIVWYCNKKHHKKLLFGSFFFFYSYITKMPAIRKPLMAIKVR